VQREAQSALGLLQLLDTDRRQFGPERAHRSGLSPVPLSRLRQATQWAEHWLAEPDLLPQRRHRPRCALALEAWLGDLPEMFFIGGIVFSHEAVRDWEIKLAPGLAESLRWRRRGKAGCSWCVDETYIKVHSQWRYLYRAIDRLGALVDVMFSEHRDMAAAKAFSESAKMVTGVTPDRVTTDGHDRYSRAIRTVLGKVYGIATASISITDWSKIIAASKVAMVRCAGSRAHDRPLNSAGPTTNCATSYVPAPEPISQSPPTTAGSTSFAAPQRSWECWKPPEKSRLHRASYTCWHERWQNPSGHKPEPLHPTLVQPGTVQLPCFNVEVWSWPVLNR
jgi:hypothetical protein